MGTERRRPEARRRSSESAGLYSSHDQAFDWAGGREAKEKAITQTESLATLVCIAIKSSKGSKGSDITGIQASASVTARLLDWQQHAGGNGDGTKRRPITLIIYILVFICVVLFGGGEKQPPCSQRGYITTVLEMMQNIECSQNIL